MLNESDGLRRHADRECTRDGLYSLYNSGVQNENFLRGVQVADANGQVTYDHFPGPGCSN